MAGRVHQQYNAGWTSEGYASRWCDWWDYKTNKTVCHKMNMLDEIRRERIYEFLEKLVRVSLPRIRDFKGIESKFDGRGNYTLGITEQIIFPEINIDEVDRIQGMNITFVTTAKTDEEGFALLKAFGLPFKNANKD